MDPSANAAIASHIQIRLSNDSEVYLYLSHPGNLASRDVASLFDKPDHAANEGWSLSSEQTALIIKTLSVIAEDIQAKIGVVYNPLTDADQRHLPDRNDEETDNRWSARSLFVRFLLLSLHC